MIWNIKKIWLDFWSKKDEFKSNVINSIFFRIDKLLYKTISQNASTPPGSPVEGEIYRVVPTGTGRFVDREDYLAFFYNDSWRLIAPQKGMLFFDKIINKYMWYDGTKWDVAVPIGECYMDHNLLHNFESFEHIDWSEPGQVKIDIERLLSKDIVKLAKCGGLSHDELVDYIPEEHTDWTEPGEEEIAIERLDKDELRDRIVCAGVSHNNDLLDYIPEEHVDWTEPGEERIARERILQDPAFKALVEPTGVFERFDSAIVFIESIRLFIILGEFDIWWQGKIFQKKGTYTVTIPDTTGTYFIFFESGETLTAELINEADPIRIGNIIQEEVLIAQIYWNANSNESPVFADKRHGTQMDGTVRAYLQATNGAQLFPYTSCEIDDYTINDDSDAGISFSLTNGQFFDEDLFIFVLDGEADGFYEQVLQPSAELPVLYRDDIDGSFTEDPPSSLPYKTAGTGRLAYNNDDGDGTYSQVEVSNNKFVGYTMLFTNDSNNPVKMLQGTQEYQTSKEAEEGLESELEMAVGFSVASICFLYRIVLQTSNAYGGTKKARITSVVNLRGTNNRNYIFYNLPT